MSSPNLDEDDLVLLNHATGDNTREECSWQDAHELLNSSVELLEDPGDYLKDYHLPGWGSSTGLPRLLLIRF